MSKIKGSVSVDIIDKQTVDLEIEMLRNRIAIAIRDRLVDLYIYDEQPYLGIDDKSDSVEVVLHGVDDNMNMNDINWEKLIDETMQDLAKGVLVAGDFKSSSK